MTDSTPTPVAGIGWARKTLAIAMHMACLALFGLTVVLPVASPIARGELAREFKPVLEALSAARQELVAIAAPTRPGEE